MVVWYVKLVSKASCFSFFPFFSQHLFLLFQLEKCFSKKKKDEMLELMKNALIAATKYLQKNLLLESTLLKDLTCLATTVWNKDRTIRVIDRLAESFSHILKNQDLSLIKDRWVFINKNQEWHQDFLTKHFKRLDSYWSKIYDIKSEVGSKHFDACKKLFVIKPWKS